MIKAMNSNIILYSINHPIESPNTLNIDVSQMNEFIKLYWP